MMLQCARLFADDSLLIVLSDPSELIIFISAFLFAPFILYALKVGPLILSGTSRNLSALTHCDMAVSLNHWPDSWLTLGALICLSTKGHDTATDRRPKITDCTTRMNSVAETGDPSD